MNLKEYIKANWQRLLDIYIFLNFLGWSAWQAYLAVNEKRFDFIEASFLIQNLVLTSLFLFRRSYVAINKNIFHQLVALVAFFSGTLFLGKPETSNLLLLDLSIYIILISNILGIATLFNLGKSFGVFISFRKLKTNGLYSVVRHPMYVTDILLRVGYLVSHFSTYTCIVFTLSTACYVYRAILEEQFLSEHSDYAAYKLHVKYRFIPYIY